MNFFLNELSVHNQFNGVDEFRVALKDLVSSCRKITEYRFSILTHLDFRNQAAVLGKPIMAVVYGLRPEERGLFISVLDKIRRWSIEPCLQRPEDTFIVYDRNVTGSSIAESACYRSLDEDAKLLSFAPSEWNISPIVVLLQFNGEDESRIPVENCFDSETVRLLLLASQAFPASWQELRDRCIAQFDGLSICENSFDTLIRFPYRLSVARSIVDRFEVLNELAKCVEADGRLNARAEEIVQNHFGSGGNFSDSSDREKKRFKNELTFRPDNTMASSLFPWHGKCSSENGPIRIHFSWPFKKDEPKYVVYVGPKLTKL